jgi:hypothetical protein
MQKRRIEIMSQPAMENDWHDLYREALMETDPARSPALIEEAYRAVQRRTLELWYASSPETKERHELDAALYFLGLLRMVGPKEVRVASVSEILGPIYDS